MSKINKYNSQAWRFNGLSKHVVPWEVHLGKIEYGRIKRVPESLACVWTLPPLRKSGIFFERGGGVYTKDTESLTLELCVLVKSGEMELFENEPAKVQQRRLLRTCTLVLNWHKIEDWLDIVWPPRAGSLFIAINNSSLKWDNFHSLLLHLLSNVINILGAFIIVSLSLSLTKQK